jgi:DNA-directed RNA polymerase subunit M/transcription elongation factor TFIIS
VELEKLNGWMTKRDRDRVRRERKEEVGEAKQEESVYLLQQFRSGDRYRPLTLA